MSQGLQGSGPKVAGSTWAGWVYYLSIRLQRYHPSRGQHRCSCRTLGPLPPITVEDARPCLVDSQGELKPEHAVVGVDLDGNQTIDVLDIVRAAEAWLD